MDITAHHNSNTGTKRPRLDLLENVEKENSTPGNAPQQLPPNAAAPTRTQLPKRATVKRAKPRGFEPWGYHVNFLSPPPRPSRISKPPPRRTVANLANTPPRSSYAERLKTIFTSPSPTRPPESAEMSGDVAAISETREDGQNEAGDEVQPEMKMHLQYKDDHTEETSMPEQPLENGASLTAETKQDQPPSSPLTSESEVERRLENFVLDSPTKEQTITGIRLEERGHGASSKFSVPASSIDTLPCARWAHGLANAPSPHRYMPPFQLLPVSTHSSPVRLEEEESSDAWTDDSKFLPPREYRREKKRQRRQRLQEARKANIERFLQHPDIPRGDVLSPQGLKIAEKAGLIYPKHPMLPGNQPGRSQESGNINPPARTVTVSYPPKPSRFTGAASKGKMKMPNARDGQASEMGEDSLPSNYRSSDADDEDSDPNA